MRDEKKVELLHQTFKPKKLMTVNEAIDKIYGDDIKAGMARNCWKFYVHLNKLPAPMERAGLIEQDGYKKGPTGKYEKLWRRV
jgi:hypothetical protein